MRKINNFQLSIINFQLIIVFLFAACVKHTEQPTVTSSYLTPYPDYGTFDKDERRLDSLLYLENIVPNDTGKVWLFINTGTEYRIFGATLSDREKSKQYYLRALALSEQLKFRTGRYRSRMEYAITLSFYKNDSALICFQEILDMATLDKDEKWIATARHNIAHFYYNRHDYTTSLEYFLLGLQYAELNAKPANVARIYWAIQRIYYMLELPEKGIEYGEKALEVLSDSPDHEVLNIIFHDLAKNYSLLRPRNFEKELELLNESLRIALLHGLSLDISSIYQSFSAYYYDLKAYEKAKEYALKAMEIDTEKESDDGICLNMYCIARIEFASQNIREAKKWAQEGYVMAKENRFSDTQRELTKLLSDISLYNRNFDDYFLYLNESDSITKSIDRDKQSKIVQDMETKYETEKKELEIERQQEVIAKQNMQRWLLTVGIAVCAVILVLLWYMLRLRNRRNLALMERNDALSEMNTTKDKFFNIISHDLRNPVVAQRDALQLLVQNSRLWDVEALTAYYSELLKSAEGQVELIYNLLGWAQLQTGRITYNPSTFNLAHRLRSDISLIRNMAEKKDITLAVNIPDDVDITGDGAMLSIVIRNLLTNAVKFTPAAGTVTMDVTHSLSDASAGYTVSVSDTGIGMSAEQISKLFRLDSAHSRKGTAGEQGSGLGLIVCRELVEKHGSELHVESEEGKGSKFWFEVYP